MQVFLTVFAIVFVLVVLVFGVGVLLGLASDKSSGTLPTGREAQAMRQVAIRSFLPGVLKTALVLGAVAGLLAWLVGAAL